MLSDPACLLLWNLCRYKQLLVLPGEYEVVRGTERMQHITSRLPKIEKGSTLYTYNKVRE
jgi:hypothetical protein